jgi:STE24 endopeptidase
MLKDDSERKPLLSAIVSDSTNNRGGSVIIGVNRRSRYGNTWLNLNLALALALALGLGLAAGSAQQASAQTAPSMPVTASPAPTTFSAQPYQLPPAELAQAKALGKIRPLIHFGAEFWELAVLWLLLSTGSAALLNERIAAKTSRNWLRAAIFSAFLAVLVFVIAGLPIDAIGHAFSRHYGISIESWSAWLLDQSKTLGLTVLLETPLLMLALALMRWSPRRYWLWFAAATVPIMLLFVFLLPPLVEPLFYDFEPLAQSHPALVQQLQRVVARTGTSIPPERMFLMKASEKSNGLNAYVSGLGASKRIVVWDTTADRMPTDEILFTFAHESGHYVLNHIPRGLTIAAIGVFALFWAVSRFAEALIRHFGKRWRIGSIASLPGLAVLLLALSILQIVTEPLENSISRHFEHEADIYGQEAIHGLIPDPQRTAVAAFNALGKAYLDDPNPTPFLEFWSYDHPSIQTRAKFAARYDPWAPGQQPQFFSK